MYFFSQVSTTNNYDACLRTTYDFNSYLRNTIGWLRLVGSLKLWVSFAEYRLFYRSLLQKRPTI